MVLPPPCAIEIDNSHNTKKYACVSFIVLLSFLSLLVSDIMKNETN